MDVKQALSICGVPSESFPPFHFGEFKVQYPPGVKFLHVIRRCFVVSYTSSVALMR